MVETVTAAVRELLGNDGDTVATIVAVRLEQWRQNGGGDSNGGGVGFTWRRRRRHYEDGMAAVRR